MSNERQEPAVLVRVTGVAPLQAQVYTLERLRCGLCGTVFTAEPPAGVGESKYDETAAVMIGLLKYGCGLPFHRIQRLEQALAIPLPATTQWDVVAAAAPSLTPVVEELARQAAQGTVLHNDDTTMRILNFTAEARPEALPPGANAARTGVFTSGVVAETVNGLIALFKTGPCHAGEHLAEVLDRRQDPAIPIQMSDALARPSCWRPCAPCSTPTRRPGNRASTRTPAYCCTNRRAARGCRRSTTGWLSSSSRMPWSPTRGSGRRSATCRSTGRSSRCSCAYPAHR